MSRHRYNQASRFTIEPGRQIYLDGKPFISVGREEGTSPWIADQFARHIARLLNKSAKAKKFLARGGSTDSPLEEI